MKTAMISDKRQNITYKTNTSMYTRMSANGIRTGQYGADIYSVDNDSDYIVLVATAHNGSELRKYVVVITANEYDEIVALHDPYNEFPFHQAVMEQLGFS